MISIIIASVKKDLLANVSKNISETIGVEFEIISFDNSNGERGLCELYNLGAKKAKYDVLCFMHEDISLDTINWGSIVFELFNQDPKLGVLGVVGSSYKALVPSGWAVENLHGQTIFANYIQSYKHSNKRKELIYNKPSKDNPANVICVDGLWFCTRKSIALEVSFDEQLLHGFHCYDIDFCLNVGRYFNVAVTFDILIHHFSEGSFDKDWLTDSIKVHKKWESILPKFTTPITLKQQRVFEKRAFKTLIKNLLIQKTSLKRIFQMLKSYQGTKVMSTSLYLKLNYYTIKYYFLDNKSFNE